ncbi:MAG TPA: hypothetical protein VK869_13795 [Rubrobacteraceae bacterium]|nr:hypothetical protein [Rubrobacteraceae bacterium]
MFWRGGESSADEVRVEDLGPIFIEPDAARPATILRVAGELEERGGEIVELFKEVSSPYGQAVLPIHLTEEDSDVFVEVETRPWSGPVVDETLNKALVLRSSEHAAADFEILSAYPVPGEVEFLFGKTPAALFQLDLVRASLVRPVDSARLFCDAARRRWDVDLACEPEYLPLVEQLLIAALEGEDAPVLDALVCGLGCFLGETIRRSAATRGSWEARVDWSEGPVVEFETLIIDPVGKARAFLKAGADDSIAFYANYALEELASSPPVADPRA